MGASEKLKELGIELPEAPKAVAAYVPVVRSGNLLYVSGQIPIADGMLKHKGTVNGANIDEAKEAARLCAINILAQVAAEAGSVDAIRRIVKITVFVNAGADFTEEHIVANGASELLFEVFGDAGRHARSAVGARLPMDAMTEVEAIIEV